jgi:3,4-dehydroadipyl-CoA semialdehyde dehydrogenase
MTELLPNYICGKWQSGSGKGTPLFDPVLSTELVRVDATGLDLAAAFTFAREKGGAALRSLTYQQRAHLLSAAVQVLQANKDAYYEISTANSGTVKNDTAVDVEGGIFTLGTYAKLGEKLGDRHYLLDAEPSKLGKDPLFQSQHLLTPTRGVALFINAFNFPSWGLWEKAAPALLSGVPVIIKPATTTAWLTQRMVKDVIQAGIFPAGALNLICGSSAGLLDQLEPFDVVSFTGSAQTASIIRSHPSVTQKSVRVNIEADSLNSALLLPTESAGSEAFELLIKEVAKEMTVKSGQKCTAIRRVFVPERVYENAAQALSARLAKTTVGNPRNESVRMGALVNHEQVKAVQEGLAYLKDQTSLLHDGNSHAFIDADPQRSCCVGPTLLGIAQAHLSDAAHRVHETEVFGPVATLVSYRNDDLAHAIDLIRKGQGSLVASIYGSEPSLLMGAATQLSDSHGRVHVISPDVAALHTGHGNVMPQSLHGGPGRAGGGEELGGIRALNFYHRRSALQASTTVLAQLQQQ